MIPHGPESNAEATADTSRGLAVGTETSHAPDSPMQRVPPAPEPAAPSNDTVGQPQPATVPPAPVPVLAATPSPPVAVAAPVHVPSPDGDANTSIGTVTGDDAVPATASPPAVAGDTATCAASPATAPRVPPRAPARALPCPPAPSEDTGTGAGHQDSAEGEAAGAHSSERGERASLAGTPEDPADTVASRAEEGDNQEAPTVHFAASGGARQRSGSSGPTVGFIIPDSNPIVADQRPIRLQRRPTLSEPLAAALRAKAEHLHNRRQMTGDFGEQWNLADTYGDLNEAAVNARAFDAAYGDTRRSKRKSVHFTHLTSGSAEAAFQNLSDDENEHDEIEQKFWMRRKDRNVNMEPEERAVRAALFVRDAINGRPIKTKRLSPGPLWAYRMHFQPLLRTFILGVVYVHIALCAFESPRAGLPPRYKGSREILLVIEWIILMIYVADSFLLAYGEGRKQYTKRMPKWRLLNLIVLTSMIVDVVCAMIIGESFVRFSRPLRAALIVIHSRDVRHLISCIGKTLPHIADNAFLIVVLVVTFGVVGVQTFGLNDFADGLKKNVYGLGSKRREDNFDNLAEASLTLFVLLSTENYPDVMYPALQLSEWYIGYFVVFLLIGVYILIAVLTAIIFDVYKEKHEKRVLKERVQERKGLIAAFQVMDPEDTGQITLRQWLDIVVEYDHNIDPDSAVALFIALDMSQTRTLSLLEFFDVVAILRYELRVVRQAQWCARVCTCCSEDRRSEEEKLRGPRGRLRAFVLSPFFAAMSTMVILSNVFMLAAYHRGMSDNLRESLRIVDFIFLSVYTVEQLIQLAGLGMRDYWADRWNRFDCLLVIGSLFAILMDQFLEGSPIAPTMVVGSPRLLRVFKLIRFVKLFRSLRMFRILGVGDRFRVIMNTFAQVFSALVSVTQYLIVVMVAFGVIGMELFAGKFQGDPRYDPYQTFDDFPRTMLTLFQQFTTSNWHETMYVARRATSGWAALYFVAYFIVMNILTATILLAIIFEIFSVQRRVVAAKRKTTTVVQFMDKTIDFRPQNERWDRAMVSEVSKESEEWQVEALRQETGVRLESFGRKASIAGTPHTERQVMLQNLDDSELRDEAIRYMEERAFQRSSTNSSKAARSRANTIQKGNVEVDAEKGIPADEDSLPSTAP